MVSFMAFLTNQHQPHVYFSATLSYLKSHSLLPTCLCTHVILRLQLPCFTLCKFPTRGPEVDYINNKSFAGLLRTEPKIVVDPWQVNKLTTK